MQTEKEKWDGAAQNYQSVFKLGINEYNAGLLRFWQENGMIFPGCRVIDIGCGVGKYGTYLAALGCDVTLTDISDEMIRHARENMANFSTPWAAFACNFDDVTGAEKELEGGFDLAISTMSPAVHDVETVRKMSRMTHGRCFIARFCDWAQPFRDELMSAMNIPPRRMFERDLNADCESILRAVTEAGYTPQVSYVNYNWSDRRTVAEMADYMRRNYFAGEENEGVLCMSALVQLENMCDNDGMVDDNVNTKVAWIYWNTEER